MLQSDMEPVKANEQGLALHRKLETIDKGFKEFVYAVSHDLQAPVRHMGSYANWLAEDEMKNLSVEGQNHLNRIIQTSKRLQSMIDELVVYSRNYHLTPQKSLIDLNILVESIYTSIGINTNVKWEIATLPTVYADKAMIHMVFKNLLSNSLKFTTYTENPSISIQVQEQEEEYIFSIADNGIGFDMAYSEKLFVVFQRLHRRTEFEGNGMGLAQVRQVIDIHGGQVWAEGVVNAGATFYFTLPKDM